MPKRCDMCGREKWDTDDKILHDCQLCGGAYCTDHLNLHNDIISRHHGTNG